MEIFIGLIIIVMICFVLNVPLSYILFGADVLFCLFALALTLGFTYCFIRLLMSKRTSAIFLRLDTVKSMNRKVAYYLVDDIEYPCMFPAENILNDQLYKANRTYKIMLDKRKKRVFDICSILTCVIGLLFGIGLSALLIILHI